MDPERFDRIAKSLAPRASRRRLVGGLAALGAIGVSALAPERAGAQEAPGLPDGTGLSTEASDRTCRGQPAINDRICPENPCGGRNGCFCAEAVNGDKRCVNIRNEDCPNRNQCNRSSQCPSGEICIRVAGCCEQQRNLCVRPCG